MNISLRAADIEREMLLKEEKELQALLGDEVSLGFGVPYSMPSTFADGFSVRVSQKDEKAGAKPAPKAATAAPAEKKGKGGARTDGTRACHRLYSVGNLR